MEAYTTYSLNVPASDITLFKSLARKFGWSAKKQRKTITNHLDLAIKASEEETEMFETDDIDVLMKSLEE